MKPELLDLDSFEVEETLYSVRFSLSYRFESMVVGMFGQPTITVRMMKMYLDNSETLSISISLPAFFVQFIDDYIATHNSKSKSQVIIKALQLLRHHEQERNYGETEQFETAAAQSDRELEQAYYDAAQEFDAAWEVTALDGLSNETW